MPRFIDLSSPDGHHFEGFEARTSGTPRGAVVVLQEIFGVNHHMQAVCERLAAAGYDAFAPALFDRMQRRFESGYSKEEVAQAMTFLPRLNWDAMVMDTLTTVEHARHSGKVAVMGFCLGASVAYMASQESDRIDAVVGYYGGHIVNHLDRAPQSPTLLHYGENDHTISMETVEKIRTARPDCEVHLYPAGHGFNCDERAAFHEPSATLAWQRSMQWLQENVG
jgi:carboxymethylenebutenolidase